MRMRFKKQLSALVAAAGLMTEKPTAYPAAGDLRRGGHVRPGARVVVGLDPAVRGRG